MKKKDWGFDAQELSADIRPQDDFYHHVHRKWMDANPIPETEARWGSFMKLRFDVEKQLKTIVEDLAKQDGLAENTPEQQIRDFYRAASDIKRRNALGISPLTPLLESIAKIQTLEALQKVLAELHVLGVGAPFGAGVEQDMKASDKYALYIGQAGLGMPDRDYYLKNDAESVRVRDAYREHVAKLFMLMGYTKEDALTARDTVLSVETKLAKVSMSKEDQRNPDNLYNKLTLAGLKKLVPAIDWDAYLKRTAASKAPYVIVAQPDFMKALSEMLSTISLADWKTYLSFHLVDDYGGALSEAFSKQMFSFYGTVLTGVAVQKPLWRRALGATNGALGEALGKLYVEKHFPPEAKKKMDMLVADLFTAYEARIKSLDWMSPATKKKALVKLAGFNCKIGHPKKWRNYRALMVRADDYVGNLMRSARFEHKRNMQRLGKPMDYAEWLMYPQTVNAYYQPTMNDIVFPAAILQPPFFSFTADDALNYGSIGSVIGHEITHGFDDEGSKFDAKGNLKSWWTKEDRERFEARAKKVEKQFNKYEVADGVKVNGKLTLGENIADLGGLSIAFDAYQLQLARTGREDIDGLTPEERFFIGFAIFERENTRPEFAKTKALTDPHAHSVFRINGPVSNFEEFYKAYGVKKGDAHYRTPKDREMVW